MQRQEALKRRIMSGPVRSQRHLVEMLAEEGFHVSQTTVSRDLEELGVTKGRDGRGKVRYGHPESFGTAREDDGALKRMAPDFLLSAEPTGNMVVVKTSVGNAQGLAAALDAAGIEGVAGTVAGDDTIMVVCSAGVDSKKISKKLLGYTTGQG